MSRDRLDDFADRLFAAARDERPDEQLVRRVLSGMPTANDAAPRHGAADAGRWRALARPAAGVCAALAACVLAVVAWRWLEPLDAAAPLISAEATPALRLPDRERPAPVAPGPHERTARAADGPEQHGAPSRRLQEAARQVQSSAPAARTTRDTSTAPAPGAPPATPLAAPPPSVVPTPAPTAATPPGATRRLSEELELLERARVSLRGGDGRAALDLLARYAATEGFGKLAAEATLLRVEALHSVGDLDAAGRLARDFVASHPDSPLSDRARSFVRRTDASSAGTPGAQDVAP